MTKKKVHPDGGGSEALILAPRGRDAVVASDLLAQAGARAIACADLEQFGRALGPDIGVAVVTEEAIASADLSGVAEWVEAQPSWSDLPFIVLTARGGRLKRDPAAKRLYQALGNVSLLERPFHATTFVSLARTALRGRQRQYEARAHMEQLHEGEERLRTAVLAGRLGSWELDLVSRELTTSETCNSVFGRGPDERFTYQELLQSIHTDDAEKVLRAARDSIASGSDWAIEFRVVWPDNSIHWIEVRARVASRREAGRARLVGVCLDITGRKAAEEALRRLNETLEERVAERTAELNRAHQDMLEQIEQRQRAEEQLRQAQKMEIIGQLTGGIAHDFNNLLMAVLSNLELLRKQVPSDAKTTRLILGALQGAQRGAALTQRLLAFARRQELRVKPESLSALIGGMAELLQRSLGAQIDLKLELPEDLPLALVDANQIELAVLNLAINGRDAMPDGGTLTISVDMAWGADDGLPPGTYLRLTVADTGHGMDEETLRKAAEPFFSTKEVGKGTGLGLSMVHGLAVQLNGALRLYSELGRGTRAELWLPPTPVTVQAGPAPSSQAVPDQPHRLTVLVVDDDALIAMSTADLLEDLGHVVLEANSGDRALEILAGDEKIDLLITDYLMPRMTGTQLAAAARELRPDLPILLATGYAELPEDPGVDLPRLAKPYQQEELRASIRQVLGGRAA